MSDNKDENLESQKEDSSTFEESSSILKPEVDSKLAEIMEELPAEKRELVRHTIQEMFVGIMERSSSPQITPEVAKIITESQDKDNEHKFQFLTQKQRDEAEAEKRADDLRTKQHDFNCTKHSNRFSLMKPIIWAVLALVVGLTIAGVWLLVIGKEAIGSALLSGLWGAVFGYLAGFGTSNFFKDDKPS
jgi:hypothetical protein